MSQAHAHYRGVVDILVVASTMPAHADDAVPRFVLDQALSLAAADPNLRIRILAPHTPSSRTLHWPRPEAADGRVTQHRFGYAPRRLETLTARGIMPAIRANPVMAAVIPLLIWGERRALRREVRRQRPDVIYAHWFTPQAIVASAIARRATIPFGFTTHASDVEVLRRLGPLGTRMVRRVTRRASFVTAVSHQTARRLFRFFEPAEREQLERATAIIPMGIHTADARVEPSDPHTVAVVARLVEKKGIHVALDAWPQVCAAVPDARLLIGGDGPMRERLERQARDLSGVEFYGYVTGEAKASLERRAGVVAVPSVVAADGDSDGLPVAAMEGFARGAYVVASDASGAHELIDPDRALARELSNGSADPSNAGTASDDGHPGAIVPAGDSAALAHALIAAIQRDSATIAQDSSAAQELAATLEWSELAAPMLRELRRTEPWYVQGSRL